ncbi:hypothetical protein DFJ74DRAFT_658770 [Hyaloraphidium curvatum]|nr:hypothetical protein DFJ74DRAFT_658770 [Hyaloraphidium curvatum]
MLLPPPTLPLPSNPPALQLPEEKLLVRLADAAYKADHLLEEYAGIRGDAWLGAVKKEAGWESSPAPLDPRRMDAGTFDLLERALRARRGVLADPERVWWTCREDATGSPLDGSNAYSVAFAEPECGDGGFWVLSVRTAEGTVSELAGTAAKRAYPSQLVAVAVGGAEGGKGDAENYLAAGPGAFELRMDVYGPRGEAGEWVPAAVLRSA